MADKKLISFDYGIKYLLKDKGDYEVVEGFISAILCANGYSRVKIKALLESESNREACSLKKSIADVIVEDEIGNKYIVEIDKSYTNLFLHKACFNGCRLIVDSVESNDDYSTIKKVFHINLIYFLHKSVKTPLQHGKTVFYEVDRDNPQDIHLADMGARMFDVYNIFPEYFIISIPLFNDVIKSELDEWLYLMKHSEIKEDFKSPYMKKVAKRLNILKMNNEERAEYRAYLNESFKNRDYIVSAEEKGRSEGLEKGFREGIEKGIEKGREEGIEKGIEKIAINMLKKGKSIEETMEITGLSEDQLEKIKKFNVELIT